MVFANIPNVGFDKPKAEKLLYQCSKNVLYFDICLAVDFNHFTSKAIVIDVKQSQNGTNLNQFREKANLKLAISTVAIVSLHKY